MNIEKTMASLRRNGYTVSYFETGGEAVEHIAASLTEAGITTAAFGGSATLTAIGLHARLEADGITVLNPDFPDPGENFRSVAMKSADADCYLLSANALSENGEIVNIDGVGNRLAGSLYGHGKVIYVIGTNKITTDVASAVYRARNVAAPKNCLRFGLDTPCAVYARENGETRCFNCDHPRRICRSMLIHLTRPTGCGAEVVLINEELGF